MNRKFYVALIFLGVLIFILNINHLGQQITYKNHFLSLGNNLINHFEYSMHDDNQVLVPSFYPMWGYSLLLIQGILLRHPDFFILTLQFILAIMGIHIFYKLFEVNKRLFHIPFFIPYFAFMSVKWPDAVVLFLLIFLLYYYKKFLSLNKFIYLIISGIALGLICIYRSDWILWAPFLIIFVLFAFSTKRKIISIKLLFNFLILFVITLLCLTPWAIRSLNYDGKFRLTSTNGGGVMYISLGQLPDNPWNINHSDNDAYNYVKNLGVNDPYSVEGDKLLYSAFLSNLKSNPFSYFQKIGINFIRAVIGGVYVGEYYTLFIPEERDKELLDFKIKAGLFHMFENMSHLEILIFSVYFAIRMLSSLVFFLFILYWIYFQFNKKLLLDEQITLIILSLILYKFLLVSFTQYEPRHMNVVYVLFLGLVLQANIFNTVHGKIKDFHFYKYIRH